MRASWPMVPLGEVLAAREETPDPVAIASGEIPIVAKIGFNDGLVQLRVNGDTRTKMILVRPGDLLVSSINAAKGAIAIYGQENARSAAATIHYSAYVPHKTRVDVRYLWWLLRSDTFRRILLDHLPGGIKTELKAARLLRVPISLPPLREQRRLVAKLDHLAAKIEEVRGLQRRATEEAEALLVSASRQAFSLHGSGGSQDIPLESCCEAIIDYRGRTPPIADAGIPHITSANIRNGRINWNTPKFITSEVYDRYMTRGLPRPGDVIFTMEAPLGEVAVVPDGRKFSLAQRTLLLRPDSALLSGDYLAKALTSPDVRSAIHAQTTVTTVRGIASKRLRKIPIPVPSFASQRHIVAYLDGLQAKVDALKGLQAQTAAELDALLPSILDKAFKGEL